MCSMPASQRFVSLLLFPISFGVFESFRKSRQPLLPHPHGFASKDLKLVSDVLVTDGVISSVSPPLPLCSGFKVPLSGT